jgi:hypothetical protein
VWLIKILLILTFVWVAAQDLKDRKVYWFLFLSVALLCGFLHYQNTLPELFMTATAINLFFVLILVVFVFLYSKLKLKTEMKHVFGSGDLLLFLGLAFSFSSISFMVLFSSALVFSLLVHLVLKKNNPGTVPLAGYMSLFFAMAYLVHWLGFADMLYKL